MIRVSARQVGIGHWRGTLWFLLGGGLMIGVGSAVLRLSPSPGLLLHALAAALGLLFYLILLLAVGQLRRAEMVLLWDVVHPLKLLGYIRSELGTANQKEVSYE